ncbi:MAG: hypothetical protein U0R69_16550 [Gaiellales bacterium]
MDALAQEYVSLALAADRLFPGLVDGYYGPPEPKAEADAGPLPEAPVLLGRARGLTAALRAESPSPRRDFLAAQARALEALCRLLAGEELAYVDEVGLLFDVDVAFTPDSELEDALAELDELLPGEGELRERMVVWRGRFELSTEAARLLLPVVIAELRARTSAIVALPPGEDVELGLVSGNPWSAYNWYRGGLRSRIEINTDLPLRANDLVDLMAHEGYPGHHTEHAVKEELLCRQAGYAEHAILLTQAPEAVISEGIAELAAKVVFPGDEQYRFQAEASTGPSGSRAIHRVEAAIDAAFARLRCVLTNAALLLHRDGATEAEVHAYLCRYGLRDDRAAASNVRFVADPLWRAYAVTYTAGRDLVRDWLDAGAESVRAARFARLLTEPLTPGRLRAELAAP